VVKVSKFGCQVSAIHIVADMQVWGCVLARWKLHVAVGWNEPAMQSQSDRNYYKGHVVPHTFATESDQPICPRQGVAHSSSFLDRLGCAPLHRRQLMWTDCLVYNLLFDGLGRTLLPMQQLGIAKTVRNMLRMFSICGANKPQCKVSVV
jgi:hypothetical protein